MRWIVGWLPLLAACGEEPETTEPPPIEDISACGKEVTGLTMSFLGVVGRSRNQPEGGVEVVLEDRTVPPGVVLGSGVSTPDGRWELSTSTLSYLEGCWGTTDFVIVAEKEDLGAELPVSREIHGAINDGSMRVDLTTQPLTLTTEE